MVKIIDGEIVPDDDPRVASGMKRAAPASSGSAGPGPSASWGAAAPQAAPAPPNQPVFNFNAPALRVIPDAQGGGQGLAGLPSVAVFGAVIRPQHLLMLAAAGLFMGWRGLLCGGIIWYVWMAQGGGRPQPQAQQPAGNQQRRVAAAQDYFQNLMGQPPLGRGGAAAGAGAAGAGRGGASGTSGASQPTDPWASRGRAYKLSDS